MRRSVRVAGRLTSYIGYIGHIGHIGYIGYIGYGRSMRDAGRLTAAPVLLARQMLRDVVLWLIINSMLLEQTQFKLLCEQNVSCARCTRCASYARLTRYGRYAR